MNKEKLINPYNGIIFSLKKEGNPAISNNLENMMLSEISQSQKNKYCMISLILDI